MYTIIWHLPSRDLSPPENVEQIKRAEKEVWNKHKLLQKKWIVSSDQACIIDLVCNFLTVIDFDIKDQFHALCRNCCQHFLTGARAQNMQSKITAKWYGMHKANLLDEDIEGQMYWLIRHWHLFLMHI